MKNESNIVREVQKLPAVKKNVGLLLTSSIVINLLSLGLPILTLQVYDRILPNQGSGTLPILISALCMVVVLEIILRLARTYLISWKGAAFEYETMSKAIKGILNADLNVVNAAGVGENLNRLTAISRLRDFYNGYTMITVVDLCFAAVFMGLIAYIGGWLVLVPMSIMCMFLISSVHYGHKLKAGLTERDHADDRRYNYMIGTLEGIHTLKAMGLEEHFMRRYERYERGSTLANYNVTMAASSSFNAAGLYAHAIIAATISFGAMMVLGGQMTAGGLIACILLSGRLMQPVQRSLGLWARYQDFMVSQEKANQILNLPQVRWRNMPASDQLIGTGVSTLSLRDVGYYIHSQNRWLFNKINLHMKQGITVHITGGHGVGRSVLLNMIAGTYRPSDGQILIEGMNIMDYNKDELVHKVGIINAESEIFRGTIMDNLTRFGLTSFDSMRDLLESLGIDRDVSKLAMGYDTFLHGVEPDTVTPGLKQRIAIARILALRPKVVLFDDADRNLDRNGYKNIIATLGALRRETALILVTDDKYISRLAQFHFELTPGGLVPIQPTTRKQQEVSHAA
jgi:ATP-binding cassette subfamily C protein LapB